MLELCAVTRAGLTVVAATMRDQQRAMLGMTEMIGDQINRPACFSQSSMGALER